MDTFKNFFSDLKRTSGTRRFVNGPRHRKSGFTDTDRYYRRKHVNLVADMYKTDGSKNTKIEQLKQSGGMVPCTPVDVQYIEKTFNIEVDGNPKKLGNTGIIVCKDPRTGNLILRR